MDRSGFAIAFATLYLLVFLILLQTEYDGWVWGLFLFSPLVVIGMVYTVIRYGKFTGRELKENEEWGYEDR